MEKYLEGKRILFIGPKFFGYEIEIKKEMERQGANVTYFSDNPFNDFFNTKFVIKFKNTRENLYYFYYKNLSIKILKEDFDYVFVIKGDMISNFFLEELKNKYDSKMIMYQWDSVKRFPNLIKKFNYFNKVMSFEFEDAQKYEGIEYLPLFYLDEYSSIKNQNSNKEIDLLFVGTNHSDRIEVLEEIAENSKILNLKTYFHIQNKFIPYTKRVLFDKKYEKYKELGYTYKSLNKNEIIELFKKSKVIVDIQALNQKGLTIRMIECLGAGKKVITTNLNVKNFDFYNKNNIYIIDRKKVKLDDSFIFSDYEELDKTIYDSYSLSNWVKKIFE